MCLCDKVDYRRSFYQIAIEPPQGLRANMMASFSSAGTGEVTKDLFDAGGSHLARPGITVDQSVLNAKNTSWKQLVFALCFFNAVIHERKKYDALGFNLLYEFTSSDLEVRRRNILYMYLACASPCVSISNVCFSNHPENADVLMLGISGIFCKSDDYELIKLNH